MSPLFSNYCRVLNRLDADICTGDEDKYSGVFLAEPFPEYWGASKKIIIVGRETAGWNTKNNKNTLGRIKERQSANAVDKIVEESIARYRNHLELDNKGNVKRKSASKFKQYYFEIAKQLDISPKAIVYANFFAWDYDSRSPTKRPKKEFEEIAAVSRELLATLLSYAKPDYVVFATGWPYVDRNIKLLFEEYFDGYTTCDSSFIPKKFWKFQVGGITCFRIAHPAAIRDFHEHKKCRQMVIQQIRESK